MDRRQFTSAGLATLIAGTTSAAQPDAGSTVVLGTVALSFYAVTGAVVAAVLRRLGHRVELREGTHEQMFPLLGDGRIDLMAAAWLPEGHASYWARYGSSAVELATLYESARFMWAVPGYVPQAEVDSIADLAKPAVAQRMTRQIQGIGAGAGISVMSQKALGDYGLDARGYSFRPGTQAEWLAAYTSAVEQKRWLVFPTWTPQYLNQGGALRPLQDPRATLGGVNRGVLVGHRMRVDILPPQTRTVLSRIRLGLDAVTHMDWAVNVDKASASAAASSWMAVNERRVSSWFTGAA